MPAQRLLPTDLEGRIPPSPAHPVRLYTRQMQANSRFPRHTHAWAQVAYSHTGVLRVQADDTAWVVPPSRAIWIPPGIEHEVWVVEAAFLRTLYVDPSVVTGTLAQCRVMEVSPLLRELIAAMDVRRPLSAAREQAVATLILDELHRSAPLPLDLPMPTDKRLRALCERVMADPGTPLTFDALAREVGASTRTLARRFRDELGVNFSQWRQQAVLASAIPLMSQGLPLSRIAQALGYNSQSAFSAMFRRAFGQSPSAFLHRPGPEAQAA
ncbi:AraC family transcriptional regulator [Ralstonia pseudosolanacearum]|uniref:AraC family transcriptional regulator n=1 Tax=Ralstonia pseudosolanacearum TaxID=1310165 RepID=UPI000DACBE05|nr:helix-turn-helix transcriptional regulator [Ralstonia pseudosolanacearum]AZU57911.1 AraC family transcriptional regulator [Ralstonia solanacearum]MCK4140124.1 AraC family transcriptional regulator [Ralstonia pseudosolanacearum]RAA05847.1 AraC family transcriptional regulator [Ralstonia pseudosolanacearum]UQY82871.1 helix-turn-helix transcriptional regulator [Ralstonia pseudosolanacearum]